MKSIVESPRKCGNCFWHATAEGDRFGMCQVNAPVAVMAKVTLAANQIDHRAAPQVMETSSGIFPIVRAEWSCARHEYEPGEWAACQANPVSVAPRIFWARTPEGDAQGQTKALFKGNGHGDNT